MLKQTGIIMSGSHPRLILDGLKTMSRRTWGLEKINQEPDRWITATPIPESRLLSASYKSLWEFKDSNNNVRIVKCPYGGIGDTLIIKETWATENQYNHLKPSEVPRTAKIWYLADEHYDPQIMGKVRSVMFMCNWMSRARPEITEVRAERLQKITDIDARKEGIPNSAYAINGITSFKKLWDSLNAKRDYGWNKNKWVWPISFKEVDHGQR